MQVQLELHPEINLIDLTRRSGFECLHTLDKLFG